MLSYLFWFNYLSVCFWIYVGCAEVEDYIDTKTNINYTFEYSQNWVIVDRYLVAKSYIIRNRYAIPKSQHNNE